MTRTTALPVCRLILSRMAKLGLSEWDLARECGYSSVAGGLRAVRGTLKTGCIHPFLRRALPAALGVDQQEFDRSAAETEWILATQAAEAVEWIERRYREEFCPYIWARFDHGNPEPNTMAVLGGVYRATYAFVPGAHIDPGAVHETGFCNLVKHHFRRLGPAMPVYGPIAGYFAVIQPASDAGTDLAVPLSTDGNIVGAKCSIQRPQFLLTRRSSDPLSNWINDLGQRSRLHY